MAISKITSYKDYWAPRPELLTTRLLKCGKTNLTTTKVTFGVSVVSFTKCVLSNPLSEPRTWKNSTRKLLKGTFYLYLASFQRFPNSTPKIWLMLFLSYSKSILNRDQLLIKYSDKFLLELMSPNLLKLTKIHSCSKL
jgi:hypothetical protein